MSKHTLNGRRRKVIKTSGFRARIETKTGRKILKNRRRKGRKRLTIQKKRKTKGFCLNKKEFYEIIKNSKRIKNFYRSKICISNIIDTNTT